MTIDEKKNNASPKLSSFYGSNFQYRLKTLYTQERDGLAVYGVHYSNYPKWGINPETIDYPRGVYFYYLSDQCSAGFSKGFATDRKYANVAKINNDRMVILKKGNPKEFSFEDFKRCFHFLKEKYGNRISNNFLKAPTEKSNLAEGTFWFSKLFNVIRTNNLPLNKTLHELGYDGIIDYDQDFLPIESCQGVITWPGGADLVESIPTPESKKNPGTDPFKRFWTMEKALKNQPIGSLKLNTRQVERIVKMVPDFGEGILGTEKRNDIIGYLMQKLDFTHGDTWKRWVE